MNKRYKKTLIFTIVALLLSITVGVSYAIYAPKLKNNNNFSLVETDEYISINYLDGKNFEVKEFLKDDVYSRRISITNVSSSGIYVTISLMDILKETNGLEVTMLDSSNTEMYKGILTNVDTDLVKSMDLAPGKTLSYTITIKNVGEDATKFSANILAYKEIVKKGNDTFKDLILANTKVVNAKTSVGKEAALENEGLIKTSDDDGDAYFFRGNVDNNNVSFAGMNWKIVRINGDDSIRLILNSAIDSLVAYNDNVEETDNYANKMNFNDSKAKQELDKWFTSNLKEYSKFIVDTTLCEDTTSFKEENNIMYLNPYNRVFVDSIPTLTCMGNKIKNNIGILNADEVVFAGANKTDTNNAYYLHSDELSNAWWTMSGSKILERSNVVDAISVNPNGSLNAEKKISTPLYIRPVISIDGNSTVTGSGTSSDPYTIK